MMLSRRLSTALVSMHSPELLITEWRIYSFPFLCTASKIRVRLCFKLLGTSDIVPYFFWIIRNLFKELCNLSDVNTFVKEFIPTIQGLLETFLQAREEASYIKETNEICYSIPAKLKNLIEYLPIISKPLLESMKSHSIELIESGINSI